MPLVKIFDTYDMLYEIVQFLDFKDKIMLSKATNKTCLLKYNFMNKKFNRKNIADLFNFYNFIDENEDAEFCDYLCDLCSDFTHSLDKYYDEYYNDDDDEYICHDLVWIMTKHDDLSELFYSSFPSICARYLSEYIENDNLPSSYYDMNIFCLEDILKNKNISMIDIVTNKCKEAFELKHINLFCKKCGDFGHYESSKKCIFYNIDSANNVITNEVCKVMNNLIRNVTERYEIYEKNMKRQPLLCLKCKTNNKKTSCENNSCGCCCDGCKVHKKSK